MLPKISVIVPVYNVEKYLPKCLDSLVEQDYKNMEIIIIEDKSSDNSLSICKKYAQKYDHIKLLENDKNEGASVARNRGLNIASGKYIGFIDSDDYVESNYYSNMMSSILDYKADVDVAICDIMLVTPYTKERKLCGKEDGKAIDFINNGLAASPCNKLFKASLFKNISFEKGRANEDLAVIIPLLTKAKKIAYNSSVCYYYVERKDSTQHTPLGDKRLDIFHAVEETLTKIQEVNDYEEMKDAIVYNQLILFLLYVPQKEKSFSKRYHFLRKFQKLSKSYSFLKNKNFHNFLNENRKIYRIYYQLFVFFLTHHMLFFSNILISLNLCYQGKKKKVIPEEITLDDLIFLAKCQHEKEEVRKKVSVVIPNYNYDMYLYERIYSILYQDYKIEEIILLDDVSKDDSRKVMDELEKKLKNYISIKKVYNQKNCGTFAQWERGMNLASSPYVWIAEADDYCDCHFLSAVMKKFDDEDVILSYSDTAFLNQEGKLILKSVKKQIDIMKTGHFNHDYINDGKDEFRKYAFLNCTIANVSSTVMKKGDYQKEFQEAKKFRQAGDWIFYSLLMQRGKIGYTKKVYNYYRVHQSNVSTTIKKESHLNEIKQIHTYYDKLFGLTLQQKKEIEKRYQFLTKAWQLDKKSEV